MSILAMLALATGVPARAQSLTAVEYFNAAFGHYFITVSTAEIAALDSGSIGGWARTGESFVVDGSEDVCRFYTDRFAGRPSHFYTPYASECASLRAGGVWTFEGLVFKLDLPDLQGACRAGTRPLYRLYNNGRNGAPNHRYTVRTDIDTQMRGQGWTAEGYGAGPVFACVPGSATPPTAPPTTPPTPPPGVPPIPPGWVPPSVAGVWTYRFDRCTGSCSLVPCPAPGSTMLVPTTEIDAGRSLRLDFPHSSGLPVMTLTEHLGVVNSGVYSNGPVILQPGLERLTFLYFQGMERRASILTAGYSLPSCTTTVHWLGELR